MVLSKIKILIFFLLSVLFFFYIAFYGVKIEGNFEKSFFSKDVDKYMASVVEKIEKTPVLVIFEGNSKFELEDIQDDFLDNLDKNNFILPEDNFKSIINNYVKNPENFLTEEYRTLLKSKQYDKIYDNAKKLLFNSMISAASFEYDPYFLFETYIKSFDDKNNIKEIDGKYYKILPLAVKDKKKTGELLKLENNNVHITGSLTEAYKTEKKSALYINIICILTTFLIIFLTFKYFKNLKVLIPIALSIIFGFLSGFFAVSFLFHKIYLITVLFETTLIGIGIDYSYHYIFGGTNKEVSKNLLFSLITTVCAFLFLLIPKIPVLSQISVFSIFALISIYCFVVFLFPLFKINEPNKPSFILKINKTYIIICVIIFLAAFSGFFHQKFVFDASAFYKPDNITVKNYLLQRKIEGNKDNIPVLIYGKNLNEVIEKRENMREILIKEGKKPEFIPIDILVSKKRQEENFNLVLNLYKNNLDKFNEFLSDNQINNLKNKKLSLVNYDGKFIDNLPCINEGCIFYVNKDNAEILSSKTDDIKIIEFNLKNYMSKLSQNLLLILLFVFIGLFIVLSFIFNLNKAFKIIIIPFISMVLTLPLLYYLNHNITPFTLISLYLILGFTLDYSIFRVFSGKKSESGIFISFITTSSAFLLLSFTPFELISSMASTLFLGTVISYILGSILISDDIEQT